MDFKEFSAVFVVMSEYFGAQPSRGLTKVYFNAFSDWKFEDFDTACQILMRSRNYNGLPKINEIKEALYGKTEDSAAIAWQSLMDTLKNHAYWDSVIFEDGAIGRTIDTMGGWITVSGWTTEEWRMRRKEFEALYTANLRRGNTEPVKLLGMIEAQNGDQFKEFTPKEITVHSQNRIDEKVKLIS